MDEPLSNLDAKLRVQMRTEVSRIQNRLGTTTVYVTHDQTEAMTLGDRVAVMRKGILQQVGSPQELYERAAQPVRRRLHRLALDELHAGRGLGRAGEAALRRGRAARSRAAQRARVLERERADGRDPARALRGREAGRRAARPDLQGQGRHPRVDGLGAVRLLQRRGRGPERRAEQLDELAADVGAEVGGAARARSRSSPVSTPPARPRGRGDRALDGPRAPALLRRGVGRPDRRPTRRLGAQRTRRLGPSACRPHAGRAPRGRRAAFDTSSPHSWVRSSW